jgi:hypothetical protein
MIDRKDFFLYDIGLYISLGSCVFYFSVFNPLKGNLNVFGNRVFVLTVSMAIIAAIAAFCYQSRGSSRETINNLNDDFYNFLFNNGIIDEILYLYRWNIKIGVFAIISFVMYNILVFSAKMNEVTLEVIVMVPIFATVWTFSEFINSNKIGPKLDEYKLEYKKICLKK